MKAIETRYKGYRFRSRLEARWAVFFDALGLKWEYEPEGFEFADGTRYLPDFYLSDLDLWVEVKPGQPNLREAYKAESLVKESGQAIFLTCGAPWDEGRLVIERGSNDELCDFAAKFAGATELVVRKFDDDERLPALDDETLGRFIHESYCFHTKVELIWWPKHDWDSSYGVNYSVKKAQDASRSARFEFGESGARITQ